MQEMMNTNYPGASASQPNAPPVLGSQVPGTNSELAAKPGLTPYFNPMAQQLQGYGRGGDTMLIHMHPDEVKGLQQLAMAHGGSLTINPHTGLPEAGFLKNLLPTILGAALNFIPGVGPLLSAAIVGGGYGLATGSLEKGLMAGLGAFGGASLAGGLAPGLTGTAAKTAAAAATPASAAAPAAAQAAPAAAQAAAPTAAQMTHAGRLAAGFPGEVAHLAAPQITPGAMQGLVQTGSAGALGAGSVPTALAQDIAGLGELGRTALSNPLSAAKQIGSRFAQGAAGEGATNSIRTTAAGMGLMGALNGQPEPMALQPEQKSNYAGPYTFEKQEVKFPTLEEILSSGGKEFKYFTPTNPKVLDKTGKPAVFGGPAPTASKPSSGGRYGSLLDDESGDYARGGIVGLKDGSFVADARTVAEIGNGSSNAGHEILSRLGGKPVRGPGDGVSDSVPARIGNRQPARVARDEVIFPPEAVTRIGGGSNHRGSQKLYAMMDKAKVARRKADRGDDTGLRRGLM